MNGDAPTESLAVVEPQIAAELALIEKMSRTELWQKLDAFEAQAEQLPQTKMPLNHIFTHGTDGKVNFCLRECFNPKGAWITTRIHMKEHVFIISMGALAILEEGKGWVIYRAPYSGVTKPGTRRLIRALEDTIISTCHVTNNTDPDEVVREHTFMGGKYADLGLAEAPKPKSISA